MTTRRPVRAVPTARPARESGPARRRRCTAGPRARDAAARSAPAAAPVPVDALDGSTLLWRRRRHEAVGEAVDALGQRAAIAPLTDAQVDVVARVAPPVAVDALNRSRHGQ
eukprot:5345276-Prymnesium_polylepis.3